MKRLPILASVLAILAACSAEPDFALLENNIPRLEYNSRTVLAFDENLHQTAFNPDDREFRMSTDDMTDFVRVVLDRIPSSSPSQVTAVSLQWSDKSGIVSKSNVRMNVVKCEEGRLWLWNSIERIGICLKIPQ